MDKDLEQAKLIANSYDGDNITTEDIVTACMEMARWKDEHAALLSEIKYPSGLIVKTFRKKRRYRQYKKCPNPRAFFFCSLDG